MRKKPSWRYYCDFCKKSGGSGGHMKNHERGCTKNKDRVCRMCAAAGLKQKPLEELKAAIGKGTEGDVSRLKEVAEGCPACMLAGIIHSGLQRPMDMDGPGFSVPFNFKSQKEDFWREVNSVKAERAQEYPY